MELQTSTLMWARYGLYGTTQRLSTFTHVPLTIL
jgi:hypothetical protein